MIRTLKNFALKIAHACGFLLDRKYGPVPDHGRNFHDSWPIPDRARRKEINQWWRSARRARSAPTGGPRLIGARLERTIEACSPKHLTCLSHGAQLFWNDQMP